MRIIAVIICFTTALLVQARAAQIENAVQNAKTQVVIIGTIHERHYENPEYSPEVLKEIILALKPNAILIELPLCQVDPNGRPLNRDRQKNPEGWAADTVAQQLGIRQIPFDRPDRQENFQRTKYFEKLKTANEFEKICVQHTLENEPNSLNVKTAQLSLYAGQAQGSLIPNATPQIINSDAYDCVIRIKQSLRYKIIPELFETYPECSELFELIRFFEDEWNTRNKIMADNIIKVAKEYPGKRLVVVTGASHRYILRDLLKDNSDIELKEFWEIENSCTQDDDHGGQQTG